MNTTSAAEELAQSISELPERVGAGACFGNAVERDGHTLIPVARVSFGYGMGFGRGSGGDSHGDGFGQHGDSGEGEGGGGGGAGSSTPVAIIDVTPDDVVIKPIMDPMRVTLSAFMLCAWVWFWVLWTVRASSREQHKTRRDELKHAS
ncbi:MAG: hypothetical protein IVW36_06540 [Dehalococcoidia bacterium]|nr:hypothetical protein [Dehalococcoidia bacterium]